MYAIRSYYAEKERGMHLVTRDESFIPLIAKGWNALNDQE